MFFNGPKLKKKPVEPCNTAGPDNRNIIIAACPMLRIFIPSSCWSAAIAFRESELP